MSVLLVMSMRWLGLIPCVEGVAANALVKNGMVTWWSCSGRHPEVKACVCGVDGGYVSRRCNGSVDKVDVAVPVISEISGCTSLLIGYVCLLLIGDDGIVFEALKLNVTSAGGYDLGYVDGVLIRSEVLRMLQAVDEDAAHQIHLTPNPSYVIATRIFYFSDEQPGHGSRIGVLIGERLENRQLW